MLHQEELIARVRDLCETDERIDAAMMYGSFAYGEGDPYSDIEFLLFFRDEAFAAVEPRAWLNQVAPVEMLYVNEHGIHCAIFANLVRGEFHFHRASEVTMGAAWPGLLTFPSLEATLIIDRSGALAPYLQAIIGPPPPRDEPHAVQTLAYSFINWTLFCINVRRRGELARALELTNILHRHLLQMARLLEDATAHWLTPSRAAECDLAPETMARFARCVATRLTSDELRRATLEAWVWGGELMHALRQRYGIDLPDQLCTRITAAANTDAQPVR